MNKTLEPSVSFRRYALLHGWARYLALSPGLRDEMESLVALRGDFWRIAVDRDRYALEYQRLQFKIHRAHYAVNYYGLAGRSHFDGVCWIETPRELIREENKQSLDRHRQRARRAKDLLRRAGMFRCDRCDDQGFIFEGDQDYPCPECRTPGKIVVPGSAEDSDLG